MCTTILFRFLDKHHQYPISDNGDNYYQYSSRDTQYVAGRRLIHFYLPLKRRVKNTF